VSGFAGALGQLAQMLGMTEGATGGALAPVLAQLENAGLGDRVRSWTGGATPLPVHPHELAQAFTPQQVSVWAAQSGTTPHHVLATLSDHLPTAVVHASAADRLAALRPDTSSANAIEAMGARISREVMEAAIRRRRSGDASDMTLDPVILSRMQFVWVVAWHILLPAFTVGLASYIAFAEGLHFATGREIWARISAFWIRIFSVAFGMGVVSGIVMPFQFGTNWSRFSDATANVIAPLLGYEGLTAFFLEATFLGVLLFGRSLVPRWVHFFSAIMVALGTLSSSFWILAANSWMQTPAGYEIVDGRFFPTDWWQVIFNPSFAYRLAHTVTAFYITTGFLVLGIAAWLVRSGRFVAEGRLIMSTTLWMLLALVPLQIGLGDLHGLNTLQYQPTKLAALEGRYNTASPAPLTLFGIPDDAAGVMRDEVAVPYLGSLLLTHSLRGEIKGLNDWPSDQRPPLGPPFFAFRIMVGIGMLMLALVVAGNLMPRGDRFATRAWFLRACQWAPPLGFIAVLAGWTTTEVGRQPWTVFGLLRAADSVSPSLTGSDVLISFIGYIVVYAIIFPGGFVVMRRIIRRGPVAAAASDGPVQSGRPTSPVTSLPLLSQPGVDA